MDAETKALLLKYLEAGADRLERGAAFVESEIPLVVQEYLSWYFWSGLLIALSLLVLWVAVAGSTLFLWSLNKDDKESSEGAIFMSAVTAISLPFILFVSGANVIKCIKVSVAPRVVILEKIAEVAK